MVDFTSILNKKGEDIKKLPPKPAGTYLCQVVGLPEHKVIPDKNNKNAGEDMGVVSFKIRPIQAMEDVDRSELEDQPPVSQWGVLPRTIDFFVHTDNGQFYLSEALTDVFDLPPEDKSLGERLAETPGKTLVVKLKHQPFMNKQGKPEIGVEIDSYAKA